MRKLWLGLIGVLCLAFSGYQVNAQSLAQLVVACDPNGTFQPCNTNGIAGFQFATIPMPNVHTDSASGYNSSTSVYTIPTTGIYFIAATIRSADNTPSVNFGAYISVNGVISDSVNFIWQSVTGIRHTVYGAQVLHLTAGNTLQMVGYCDNSGGCQLSSSQMEVMQLCDPSICSGTGGSANWASLTGGTLTGQALVVGNTASLAATGTGTITATAVPAGGITGTISAGSLPAATTGALGAVKPDGTTITVSSGTISSIVIPVVDITVAPTSGSIAANSCDATVHTFSMPGVIHNHSFLHAGALSTAFVSVTGWGPGQGLQILVTPDPTNDNTGNYVTCNGLNTSISPAGGNVTFTVGGNN